MLLYYVRHGDPIYDPDSLTPLGQEQAKALAKRLIVHGVDKVYSSPSNRARMTAQPLCDLLKKEINICPWADEALAAQDFMIIREDTGYNWSFCDPELGALFNSPEVFALGKKWYEHPAFEGTTYRAGVERIERESDAWLASLGWEYAGRDGFYRHTFDGPQRVALFAHQGFGTFFLSHVLGIAYPQFSQTFDISHTSLTVIEFDEKQEVCIPCVYTMANDAHLYREDLPIYTRPVF